MNNHIELFEVALRAMNKALDDLCGACMDALGNPVSPTRAELAKARASLSPYCKNAFKKKGKK